MPNPSGILPSMTNLSTKQWNSKLAPFTESSLRTSIGQLALTLVLYLGLLGSALTASALLHPLAGLPLSVASGLFLVRVFVLQHDCGHRSFLSSAQWCDRVGAALSVLTLVPYGYWRRDHDKHHATAGDLDRRGHGDIDTLTVAEYLALSRWGRLKYRLYRHPAILFGIGPTLLFLLRYRVPLNIAGPRRGKDLASIMWTNLALAVWLGLLLVAFGWQALALAWVPSVATAATIGVWLFFVQHQIEDAYWRHSPEWSFADAALLGCSMYRLPRWLDWCFGWISHHHVHHLASRVPNYRLVEASVAVEREGASPPTIGMLESLKLPSLALWCEARGRMVRFRDVAHA